MPETNWILNDSAPVAVGQEFNLPEVEKQWGWFGLPAAGEGLEFSPSAAPWAKQDWLSVLGYQITETQSVATSLLYRTHIIPYLVR